MKKILFATLTRAIKSESLKKHSHSVEFLYTANTGHTFKVPTQSSTQSVHRPSLTTTLPRQAKN